MKEFHKIIKEICGEENIKYSLLSKDLVTMLEKDSKTRFIFGNRFDLNGHGIGKVMDDKYAMYEVLKAKNLPVIEHHILFRNKRNDAIEFAKNYFYAHNNSIVIKANDGCSGNEVFRISDINEIEKCLDNLFANNYSISICPFYDIKFEYRFIMLRDKCLVCYGKKRPVIVGDGIKTIRQLLTEFNPTYFKDKVLPDEYKRVLNLGETFEYEWKFNLAHGAVPFEITDNLLKKKLNDIAAIVSKKFETGFCSIDIIETQKGELLVLEINSAVSMEKYFGMTANGYEIAKDTYRKAILEMFK